MKEETGWLIERTHLGYPVWFAGSQSFTDDSLKAIRFSRQKDAQRYVDTSRLWVYRDLKVTEHIWL
jgi:hypothetical protein